MEFVEIVLECGVKVPVVITQSHNVVIAKALNCEDLAIRSMKDVFHSVKEITVKGESRLWKMLQMNTEYRCIAKCHPNDVYDFEKGKWIALIRLTRKLDEKVRIRRYHLSKELFGMAVRCCSKEDVQKITMKRFAKSLCKGA